MEDLVLYLSLGVNFFLHLDAHLTELLAEYGHWLYAILFIIIFCETGLVVTPFLPGDSLLFTAGALAAGGGLNPGMLMLTLFSAAVLGDAANYVIGKYFGDRMMRWESSRFFNRSAVDKTHAFYERHGGKTIIIARFVPVVRTFAPFVAGMGHMPYRRFGFFNIIGAALWVMPLTMLGYWFGNLPWIKSNLTAVILGIIALSLLPVIYVWLQEKYGRRQACAKDQPER